jgi:hypothetical protein
MVLLLVLFTKYEALDRRRPLAEWLLKAQPLVQLDNICDNTHPWRSLKLRPIDLVARRAETWSLLVPHAVINLVVFCRAADPLKNGRLTSIPHP